MKKIEKGIVFSNDIERILRGYNALNFNYLNRGLIIPSGSFIEILRKDFETDVKKIFDNVLVLDEECMTDSIYQVISDVYSRYPHCNIR